MSMSSGTDSAVVGRGSATADDAASREGRPEPDWQSHPSVNVPDPCPYCGARALHAQHCKRMCLACGWFRSCVD